MKRFAWLLLLSFLILPPAAGAGVEVELFEFEGFDYEFPDNDPDTLGAVGDWYNMFGLVQSANPSFLTTDFVANEYTCEFYNLWSQGFIDFEGFRFIQYNDGMLQLYEDDRNLGTPAIYGINPPNATVPSTFKDGLLLLVGDVTGFGITLNLANSTGSFIGEVDFTGGSQIGNIPPDPERIYTFAGLTAVGGGSAPDAGFPALQGAGIPEGYVHQVAGSVKIEQAVQTIDGTWGQMKALYR